MGMVGEVGGHGWGVDGSEPLFSEQGVCERTDVAADACRCFRMSFPSITFPTRRSSVEQNTKLSASDYS